MSQPNFNNDDSCADVVGCVELDGGSPAIARVRALVKRAAALDTSVLVVGARGVDVVSIAREVHERSRATGAPFLTLDCGRQPGGALERVLFGTAPEHAPTDLEAVSGDSLVATAGTGTLCLRDVTEMPAAVQTRLSRLLRDGEMRVDGAIAPLAFGFVATAPPSIDADVREHRFRGDLYRRVAALRIDVPPLSDRAGDIAPLASRLLDGLCSATGAPRRRFTQAALALLSAFSWPGNLAELSGVIERVATQSGDDSIRIEHVLPALQLDRSNTAFVPAGNLREARQRFERDYIAAVLQHHGWRVADAAQTLGIQRPNLYRKARQLGIPVTRFSEYSRD